MNKLITSVIVPLKLGPFTATYTVNQDVKKLVLVCKDLRLTVDDPTDLFSALAEVDSALAVVKSLPHQSEATVAVRQVSCTDQLGEERELTFSIEKNEYSCWHIDLSLTRRGVGSSAVPVRSVDDELAKWFEVGSALSK